MPKVVGFGPDGKVAAGIKKDFAQYWELSREAAEVLRGVKSMSNEELMRMVLSFLQINYAVGAIDLYAMMEFGHECFSPEFMVSILGAVTMWEMVGEYEEKKTTQPV